MKLFNVHKLAPKVKKLTTPSPYPKTKSKTDAVILVICQCHGLCCQLQNLADLNRSACCDHGGRIIVTQQAVSDHPSVMGSSPPVDGGVCHVFLSRENDVIDITLT